MLSVAEALNRVLGSVTAAVEEETVGVGEAFGRTLARDVIAARTQPPFANSAMDGYAVRAVHGLSSGTRLRCIGESAAGREFQGVVGAGEAVRIFTGAPLPNGADSVVIQEAVQRQFETVTLNTAVHVGEHVRAVGIDFREGEALLHSGLVLTPRDVALAAAANCPKVFVRRRPRVAILATGDELVAPGEIIGDAQIVASNNFFVAGLVRAAGGEALDLGIAADNAASLAQKIEAARSAAADVLVTLGGASVGDYDLVQGALTNAGMELGFWKIAMRPGKPLMHGRIAGMQVLGLPGNPTSSAVCALLFLRPLLRALLGQPHHGRSPVQVARLASNLPPNGSRQEYVRASLSHDGRLVPLATPMDDQDSSLVKTLAMADALIVRPPEAAAASAGEPCEIISLSELGA